jgi:hypothetical protein
MWDETSLTRGEKHGHRAPYSCPYAFEPRFIQTRLMKAEGGRSCRLGD